MIEIEVINNRSKLGWVGQSTGYNAVTMIERLRDAVADGGSSSITLFMVHDMDSDSPVTMITSIHPDVMNAIGNGLNLINGKIILESKINGLSGIVIAFESDDSFMISRYSLGVSKADQVNGAATLLANILLNANPKFKNSAGSAGLKGDILIALATGKVPRKCIFRRSIEDLLPILKVGNK